MMSEEKARSEQDTMYENKISLIEECINLIYELHKIIQDHPPALTRVILKSLGISLLQVTKEMRETDVGKLEAKIKKLRERDLELNAVISHMADQLIGRVPIKPCESTEAKDALIVDLQSRHNDLVGRLKEATKQVCELIVESDDLQKCKASLVKDRDQRYEDSKKAWVENKHLKDQLAEAHSEIGELEEAGRDIGTATIVQLQRQIGQLKESNSDLIKANSRLEKQYAESVAMERELRSELNRAEHFEESLVSGLIDAFGGVLDEQSIRDSLDKIIHRHPDVENLAYRMKQLLGKHPDGFEAVSDRVAELEEALEGAQEQNRELRKQEAVKTMEKAAPGAWKVVAASPDDDENEETSPEENEESRES